MVGLCHNKAFVQPTSRLYQLLLASECQKNKPAIKTTTVVELLLASVEYREEHIKLQAKSDRHYYKKINN